MSVKVEIFKVMLKNLQLRDNQEKQSASYGPHLQVLPLHAKLILFAILSSLLAQRFATRRACLSFVCLILSFVSPSFSYMLYAPVPSFQTSIITKTTRPRTSP